MNRRDLLRSITIGAFAGASFGEARAGNRRDRAYCDACCGQYYEPPVAHPPCGPQYGGQPHGPVRRTYILGTDNKPKQVYFTEIDGQAIYQGDIILGPADKMDAIRENVENRPPWLTSRGLIIADLNRRWPDAVIPYCIRDDLPKAQRVAVADAIDHWQKNTRIRFYDMGARCNLPIGVVIIHVNFIPSTQCASAVGCQQGIQAIELAPGCGRGQAIHEIGHCVGLWHEQSRHDRDSHVSINLGNVRPENQHNFQKELDSVDVGRYDFGSIMHYGAHDFAINPGIPVITTIPPGQPIGQREALSPGDIAAVAAMYP